MITSYTRIAGQSLDRLAALSDGIFAVVMTLLVLDLRVPVMDGHEHGEHPLWHAGMWSSEREVWHALMEVGPHVLPYAISFMTLGIFWIAQQTQFNHFARTDRNLTWIHLVFLAVVSLMPFSTGLLSEYVTYRIPFVLYWLNLLFLGLMMLVSLRYARRAGLLKAEATDEVLVAQRRRVYFYQVCYAAAVALCVVNTYVSMVALILLQLASALAPPIPPFNRY
ncbi:TMEM175 family protein [Micromonospora chersina]|uniref:TMEM175 family protein n=1 Tax=Micromonospora chersina TaxID=47854 RepID=UPI0036AC0EF5